MTKTVLVSIEIHDDTTISEIEEIVGNALEDEGVGCIYNVEEKPRFATLRYV